jgi:hypothetical protein
MVIALDLNLKKKFALLGEQKDAGIKYDLEADFANYTSGVAVSSN